MLFNWMVCKVEVLACCVCLVEVCLRVCDHVLSEIVKHRIENLMAWLMACIHRYTVYDWLEIPGLTVYQRKYARV